MRCTAVGPAHARIALIGEAPGEREALDGLPFVGSAGQELDRMLADAGIDRSECFVSNCVQDRPGNNDISLWVNPNKTSRPGEIFFRNRWVAPNVAADVTELHHALKALKPAVIVPLGNTPLWALTDCKSVDKWRGSFLSSNVEGLQATVVPTYHPAAILRQYSWRSIAVSDLKRARNAVQTPPCEPVRRFTTNPTYFQVLDNLTYLLNVCKLGPTRIVCDLEIKRSEIVCAGLAWSRYDAICIPFYNEQGRCFTAAQATEIWWRMFLLFSHPNCRLSNQNISFDIQFLFEKAGIWPRAHFDTMLAQNLIFPGTPKSLDYLASMYCDWYRYWKDDGKFWDKPIIFPQLWAYNCLDCVYTYEIQEKQEGAIQDLGLTEQMAFQVRVLNHTLRIMFRGARVSERRKASLRDEIATLVTNLQREASYLAGFDLVAEKGFSNKRLQALFYERLALPPIRNRKTGAATTDDDALASIAKKEPILAPLVQRINFARSYQTALNVCSARTDKDGRWRTAYNVAGTATHRFSSSENPFGSGLNLQNLTTGKDITQ